MSLPPGFLDELRGRLSLGQVVGRKVIWDARKSNQGKGDLWAPCPFHQEKTASFHVDDRKGYYYCFGCQAKGDAIAFVRETENVGFLEAVEILAREAGLAMPAPDPAARAEADRKDALVAAMEAAVGFYRLQLRTAAAAEARAYLERRGLDSAAQERWQIGFAPAGWEALRQALTGRGLALETLLECGLVRPSDRGRAPYDTFRNRILFPIRDARGRAIAFGGRALDPGESAKYLNSPDTPLFDKGRALYNHGPAREAAGRGAPLIVAEGYMDVIALVEAGFPGAVAALGTAVTEHHLAQLWRIADEPVVALDGDAAGLKAALRLVGLALPLLAPGKSLRFALLPGGLDPDDLVRARGPQAMREVIEGAEPLVALLWRRETEGRSFDSPERRAALDAALAEATRAIRDPGLRRHYDEALRQRRWQLFARPGRGRRPAAPPLRDPTRVARLSAVGAEERLCEAAILAALVATPAVLAEFEAEIERLDCAGPGHAALRDAILRAGPAPDLRARLAEALGAAPLDALFADPHVAITPAVRRPGDLEVARLALAGDLARLNARRSAAREIADAEGDIARATDEGITWRLAQAARSLQPDTDSADDPAETEVAANGVRESRDMRARWAKVLGEIDFGRGGRGG